MVCGFEHRPYTVHITPKRGNIRRYVCRRATAEQAAHAADKLLKGAPGALVEVYRGRLGDANLVAVIRRAS